MVNTGLSWVFKEQARLIWKGNRVRGAKSQWQEWLALIKASRIKPMITAADTVKEHLSRILQCNENESIQWAC